MLSYKHLYLQIVRDVHYREEILLKKLVKSLLQQ